MPIMMRSRGSLRTPSQLNVQDTCIWAETTGWDDSILTQFVLHATQVALLSTDSKTPKPRTWRRATR